MLTATKSSRINISEEGKTKSIAEGRSEDFFKETGENADSEIMQTFESTQNSIWNGAIENWVEFQSTTVV